MEGLMFSTPMIISPVDMEPHLSDVEEMLENSATPEYFASEMEQIPEPHEGMEFDSEEAARVFYNTYAAQMGFKARVSSFIRSKRDKTIISRQFVCSREGFRSNKESNNEGRTKRPRMITRVGCRAMIMVKKQSSGKWIISKCEKVHNHVLGTQGKVVMLDFDPYARPDELIENTLGVVQHGDELLDKPLEMVVVPPEGHPSLEPRLQMEFDSENDALLFYKAYARRVGFRARVSSYYRSKRDNSIISRLIVCSKEGFRAKKDDDSEERLQRPRAITRIGCKAMIMVKKRDSGKWMVSKLIKNHNHVLTTRTSSDEERSEAEDDEMVEAKRTFSAGDGDAVLEPYEGMKFESEEAAKIFYFAYSRHVGFNMRVSTYYRSKRDKSIISRLFVCSKEGFYVKKGIGSDGRIKRPREATRIGCKAMLMVKKNNSGRWVVSKFEKEHNHGLGALRKLRRLHKRKHSSDKARLMKDQTELQNSDQESSASRYSNLCREAIKYAEVGATSPDVYNVAINALREAVKKVAAMKKDARGAKHCIIDDEGLLEGSVSFEGQIDTASSMSQQRVRTRPSKVQSKISFEEIPQNMRICGTCKQPVDHKNGHSCMIKQPMMVTLTEQIDTASCEPLTGYSALID